MNAPTTAERLQQMYEPLQMNQPALPVILTMDRSKAIDTLVSSLYPGAKRESAEMVLAYCEAAGLDPMQKPVHIVPMSVKTGQIDADGNDVYEMRDVVMPGIGLYRIQATRTGAYAGQDEPEFGPMVPLTYKKKIISWENGQNGRRVRKERWEDTELLFPQWCKVTVYRLVQGHRVPFTAKEFWLENYGTASAWTEAPNKMWERRTLAQLAKCFDSETEVLTTNGFEKFATLTGQVLQVTDQGLQPCDAVPFVQPYDGEMIVADGTRLNFSVTPNHDMLTSNGKIEAGDLYEQATKSGDKFQIPRAPVVIKPDLPVSDAVLRLVGYFMADGSHTGHRQMRIAVSRPWKIEALRELSLHQSEGIKRDAGRVAVVGSRAIATVSDKAQFVYDFGLIESMVSADKQINVETILALSQRQARVIADAIVEFDGSDNGGGVRRLTQKNGNVLRGFEVIAVHAGYSVSARAERTSDIGESASITISEAGHFPVVRGVDKNSASLVKRRNVAGSVWCVTVPSGVIVVRRKGFSMLCGNCAEAQALRKGFPDAVSSGPTADEMEGKHFDMDLDEAGNATPTPTPAPAEPPRKPKTEATTAPAPVDQQQCQAPAPAPAPAPASEAAQSTAAPSGVFMATGGEKQHIKVRCGHAKRDLAEVLATVLGDAGKAINAETLEGLTKEQFKALRAALS